MTKGSPGTTGSADLGPPTPVRLAGWLTGLEGLVVLGLAGFIVLSRDQATIGLRAVLGQAGFVAFFGVLMLAVAAGLVRGRSWARTPGILIQALLLPAMFSLLGPSGQVLVGLVGGAVAITGLVLLLGRPARAWAERRHQLGQD